MKKDLQNDDTIVSLGHSGKPVTIGQIRYLDGLRQQGVKWSDIVVLYNTDYDDNLGELVLRKRLSRFKVLLEQDYNEVAEISELTAIKQKFTSQKTSTANKKITNLAISEVLEQEQFLAAIDLLTHNMKFPKIPTLKPKYDSSKKNKTWLINLSDLHNGKLIVKNDTKAVIGQEPTIIFNNKIFRARMRELAKAFTAFIQQDQVFFNVECIIINMLGDFIENSLMHGIESMAGSEYQNSEQIQNCIESIYIDFIVPISRLGIKILVKGVTGNHDRITEHKTYSSPGKTNCTWNIYQTLKRFCELSNINAEFEIATDSFLVYKIYGKNMLIEHGDEMKGLTENGFKLQTQKRESQISAKIDYTRCGHFHAYCSFGMGKYLCNGSLPGQDDYALNRGYETVACQIIESFLDCGSVRNSYYGHHAIQLDHILE